MKMKAIKYIKPVCEECHPLEISVVGLYKYTLYKEIRGAAVL